MNTRMEYRPLGQTGIRISALSFGAGPVSGLMTGSEIDDQAAVVRRAIDRGVNWFDTAATYGAGRSEESLGAVLARLGRPAGLHVGTKVRLAPDDLGRIGAHIRESVAASLCRLGVERVTLLQLHNSVTARRGDEPTSITPEDVLGPGGVLEAFEELRERGLVEHLGLTGIGQPDALKAVVQSRRFQTIQIPYHVLNPSAGRDMPESFSETNYGNVIGAAAAAGMGVLAIRVFAAGAILGSPPSAHTLKTPFFPLALYERDRERGVRLAADLGPDIDRHRLAIRFVLSHPAVSSALIGFGAPAHVDEALAALKEGELPAELQRRLAAFADEI